MNDDLSRRVNYRKLKANLRNPLVPRPLPKGYVHYHEEDIETLVKFVETVEIYGDYDIHLTAQIFFDLADATIRSAQDHSPLMRFYHHMQKVGEYHVENACENITKGVRHEPISAKNMTLPTNQD